MPLDAVALKALGLIHHHSNILHRHSGKKASGQ
jgi:hypothetical protein